MRVILDKVNYLSDKYKNRLKSKNTNNAINVPIIHPVKTSEK